MKDLVLSPTGRLVVVSLGMVLLVAGLSRTVHVEGALVGIPLTCLGLLLMGALRVLTASRERLD